MIEIKNLYVTFTEDKQINGYYCQVYDDYTCDNEVDNFCLHDCTDLDQAELKVRLYYE